MAPRRPGRRLSHRTFRRRRPRGRLHLDNKLTIGVVDHASLVPAPARADHRRADHPAQPRPHGLDARRPRGAARRLRADGRLLRRAGEGRSRPHRHRRHRAQRRGGPAARRQDADERGRRRRPPAHHRRGPRRGRQDRDADPAHGPLRLPPGHGRAVADPGADQPFRSAGDDRGRHPADHRRLRPVRAPGAAGRLRRRRDHGLRGLPHQPVHRHPHQPAHRRLGRLLRGPHALPARDHPPGARRRRRRLRPRLPPVDARPRARRLHPRRGRRAGPRGRGRRRRHHQHRHRVARGPRADDRHPGPARRMGGRDEAPHGRRHRPARRDQPDQHPRGRRAAPRRRLRRHGLHGPALPRRPRAG